MDPSPKFVKQYTNLANETKKAVNNYIQEVRNETFPDADHSYTVKIRKLKTSTTDIWKKVPTQKVHYENYYFHRRDEKMEPPNSF